MIAKVVTENGVKKLVPLAGGAQIGSGLPLGTIIPVYSNVCPSDYLPCNGVAFDENQFPALYQLLGDNHTPDLRECTLKMIGENPNGEAHVKSGGLAVGEFVDDRVQSHRHSFSGTPANNAGGAGTGTPSFGCVQLGAVFASGYLCDTNTDRKGDTTEVKAVGVNYVIKATSGLETGQQEYVLQALNEAGSYSTEEVATGKKWIDGKTIYRRVIDTTFVNGTSINIESYNIYKMISLKCIMSDSNNNFITINPTYFDGSATVYVYYSFTYKTITNFSNASFTNNRPCQFILEYTKTT